MDFEAANKARDRRLRRGMLHALHHARGSLRGGLNAQTLLDVVDGSTADGNGFEDGDHFIRLARDLKNKSLLTEKVENVRRGQRLAPHHLFLSITDKGSRLVNETEPPDPDIDDERVEVA